MCCRTRFLYSEEYEWCFENFHLLQVYSGQPLQLYTAPQSCLYFLKKQQLTTEMFPRCVLSGARYTPLALRLPLVWSRKGGGGAPRAPVFAIASFWRVWCSLRIGQKKSVVWKMGGYYTHFPKGAGIQYVFTYLSGHASPGNGVHRADAATARSQNRYLSFRCCVVFLPRARFRRRFDGALCQRARHQRRQIQVQGV